MASVLVVDDDQDLRETLGELIGLLGHGSVLAGSFAEVVTQREAALRCALALLDVNLGPNAANGVEVYDWLLGEHFGGRILFLTGHARSHPVVAAACASGARVVEKPIRVDDLRALLPEAA